MGGQSVQIILEFIDKATAPLQGAISSVQGSFGNLSSGFASVSSTIGDLIENSRMASAEFAAAFTLIGKQAIDVAGDFERVGVMTKFLTKTPADAEKFTKSLIDLAVGSQFSTKEITTLGARTIGIVPDVDKASFFMNALTNAVSATGGGIMELNNAQRALTQTYIKAHPALEELNKQFTNAQIPIMQVMAEALSSGAIKLKGYTDAVVTTGGASAKMSKQFQKTSEDFDMIVIRSEKAEKAMSKAASKFGTNSLEYKEASEKVEIAHRNIDKAKDIINKYNTALSSTGTSTSVFHKSIEQIKADLQDPELLKTLAGSDFAVAAAESIMVKWKDANKVMLSTFQGSSRNILDQVEVIEAMILGLDKSFGIKEGSIFYYLKKGVVDLSNALTDHRQDIVNFFTGISMNKDMIIGLAAVITTLLVPVILWLLGPWTAMGGLLILLAPLFFAVGEGVVALVKHFGGLQQILKDLRVPFQILTELFQDKDISIKSKDVESWKWLAVAASQLQDALHDLQVPFEIISELIQNKDIAIKSDDVASWGWLAAAVSRFQDALYELKPKLDATIKWIMDNRDTIIGAIAGIASVISLQLVTSFILWAASATKVAILTASIYAPIVILGAALGALAIYLHNMTGNWDFLIGALKGAAIAIAAIVALNFPAIISSMGFALSQMATSLGLGIRLMGGWPMIAVAAGVALGSLIATTGILRTHAENVAVAEDRVRRAMDDVQKAADELKRSEDDLKDAHMRVEGAALAVERAQNDYNEALKLYGPQSLQAREASFRLKEANLENEKATTGLAKAVQHVTDNTDAVIKKTDEARTKNSETLTMIADQRSGWDKLGDSINDVITKFLFWSRLASHGTKGMPSPIPPYQHGGIIPGPIGAPVPILAHGGEMVTPTTGVIGGGNQGGGGITINMTGAISMDSEDRVRQLAYQIVRILGRQNELARYGTGY